MAQESPSDLRVLPGNADANFGEARLLGVIAVQNEIAAGGLNLSETMRIVAERAQAMTGASGAVVELAEGDEMVYHAVSGTAQGSLGVRLRRDASLSGLSVITGEIQRCDDATDDPRVDREACLRVGVVSMICVPLRTAAGTVGVLKVLSPVAARFDDLDVRTLELLADVIAAGINSATVLDREVSASSHKTAFLTHVSHELRTPLTAILGFTDILLEGGDGPLTDSQREDLEHVRRGAVSLRTLINELLDLSRIEAGQTQLDIGPVEVDAVVSNAVASLRPLFEQAGLQLDRDVPPGLAVAADAERLQQILINLIGNALKFTSEGGVTVGAAAAGDVVDIWVRDTGPGISSADQELVFEAFAQVHGPRAREGSGLGLAICRGLVQLMEGTITVSSELNQGTCFTFTLPAATGN